MSAFGGPLSFYFVCRFVFVELPDIRKDVQCPICLGTLIACSFSSLFRLAKYIKILSTILFNRCDLNCWVNIFVRGTFFLENRELYGNLFP